MGDSVKIKVVRVNLDDKKIDFELLESAKKATKPAAKAKPRSKKADEPKTKAKPKSKKPAAKAKAKKPRKS